MSSELFLRRKLTFRAHGQQVVFIKKQVESLEHVLMKAFLWALYLPDYPALRVERAIGDKYKPDVVALDAEGRPRFWGEAGKVGTAKIVSITRRYPETHFALAKWNTSLEPHAALVRSVLAGRVRPAPIDLLAFPRDSAERFIDECGHIHLSRKDLIWRRL